MELNTECKLVRGALLVSIMCRMLWLAVWSFASLSDSQNDVVLGTKTTVSGFDEINLYNSQKADLFSSNIYLNTRALFVIELPYEFLSNGEQFLFLKENRLFMLQYSGDPPRTLDIDQKKDFKSIMNSFEVI